jgi:biotin carboxylase
MGASCPKNSKVAVIVDAYSTGRFLAPLLAAEGFECHHVQSLPTAPPVFARSFRAADFRTNTIHDGTLNGPSVERLASVLNLHNPTVLLAGSESAVPLVDLLADALTIPGNGTSAAHARRHKHEMQRVLESRGLAAIRTQLAATCDEAVAAARAIGGPVVVKPAMSGGAEDVRVCDGDAAVRAAAGLALGKVNALGVYNDAVVVQELISGAEFIVNAVSCAGQHRVCELFLCRKTHRGDRRLSSVEELIPAAAAPNVTIVEFALTVLDALDIRYGPTHLELMWTAAGPRLIELAARMQGAVDPAALVACTGTSHPHLTVEAIAAPERFLRRPTVPRHLIRRLFRIILCAHRRGTIDDIPGVAVMRQLPSYFSHSLGVGIGDLIDVTHDFVAAPGYVHCIHDDIAQLEADTQRIRSCEENGFFTLRDSSSPSAYA